MNRILLKYKPRYLYQTAALLSSVLLALFTFLQPGASLVPGIDSSWAYGINYTFENNLVVGKDVYFTFGPLGFLEHTAPFNLSMFNISSWFWFICSITSYFLILLFCRSATKNPWMLLVNIALGLLLIFYASSQIQRLLLICYTCAFLHWRTQHVGYLLVMAIATILSMMIKFSYGITALALYFPYLLLTALREQNTSALVKGTGMIVLLYLLGWVSIYGSLAGVLGYFKGGIEFSNGSISAMASNSPNNWWAIAGFYTAFLCATLIVSVDYRKAWIAMPFCFFGPLFIWSKYAFGREDSGHLACLMPFVLYVGALWMIAAQNIIRKIACAIIITASFIWWTKISIAAAGTVDFKPQITFFKPRSFESRWNREPTFRVIQSDVERQLASLQLDPAIRQTIGDSSVDIYPWETLIAHTNHLNWTPRPIYQSYITYTPFLDRKNAEFYASTRAPEFIVWHYHSDQDIDNRYSFSSNPLTLQALLTYYKQEQCQGSFCLWRHAQQDQLVENTSSQTIEAEWNTWIDLPTNINTDVIRAHIHPQRTLLGRLNRVLWKEGGIEIDYRLRNSEIKTHTLVIDNAISGLWASPYVAEHIATNKAKPVSSEAVKKLLAEKPAEGYIEKAELTSHTLHVAGWGLLPFKNTQTQQLQLLLVNNTNAYAITAQNRPRPGITEHFGKTGMVDLDYSGINETIETRGIAPGKYQLHFVVTNEGETRVHTQMPALLFDIGADKTSTELNVTAIRLRTDRPWAFTKTVTATWSTLTFQTGLPF
jgi:hypothetical protein